MPASPTTSPKQTKITEAGFSIFKTPIKKLIVPLLSEKKPIPSSISNTSSSTLNESYGKQVESPFTVKQTIESNTTNASARTPHSLKQNSTPSETPTSILQSLKRSNLLLEYSSLRVDAPPGCYVIPDSNDNCLWHGVLFVHEGPFSGIVVRFCINWESFRKSSELLFSIGRTLRSNNSSKSDLRINESFVENERSPLRRFDNSTTSFIKNCSTPEATPSCIQNDVLEGLHSKASNISSTACNQQSFSNLPLQLPVIKILSSPESIVHPLIKNFDELDISLFFSCHNSTKLSASNILHAICDCFSAEGITKIIDAATNPQLSQCIVNIDAIKILLNDPMSFYKLAKDAAKTTCEENVLYKNYNGFSFQPNVAS